MHTVCPTRYNRVPQHHIASQRIMLPFLEIGGYRVSGVLPADSFAPRLTTSVPQSPYGGLWLHQIKWDGFRQAVSLYSHPRLVTLPPGCIRSVSDRLPIDTGKTRHRDVCREPSVMQADLARRAMALGPNRPKFKGARAFGAPQKFRNGLLAIQFYINRVHQAQ
jgi:hypothetical protein